ncbi:MAG: hypothetical protein LBR10_08690 [Prevotellaceae bacterium]|nr:hypothetical protein [Prevotellaceae bacterium]
MYDKNPIVVTPHYAFRLYGVIERETPTELGVVGVALSFVGTANPAKGYPFDNPVQAKRWFRDG